MRRKLQLQTLNEGEMLRIHEVWKVVGHASSAKNNLNAYLAIYSTVCVLWAAVRLTQQRTLMIGDKNSDSSLSSYEWQPGETHTAVTCCFNEALKKVLTACDNVLHIGLHSLSQCSSNCIYEFCMDLRTNNDYFPIQHWLVFITETECVYCAVRTAG